MPFILLSFSSTRGKNERARGEYETGENNAATAAEGIRAKDLLVIVVVVARHHISLTACLYLFLPLPVCWSLSHCVPSQGHCSWIAAFPLVLLSSSPSSSFFISFVFTSSCFPHRRRCCCCYYSVYYTTTAATPSQVDSVNRVPDVFPSSSCCIHLKLRLVEFSSIAF